MIRHNIAVFHFCPLEKQVLVLFSFLFYLFIILLAQVETEKNMSNLLFCSDFSICEKCFSHRNVFPLRSRENIVTKFLADKKQTRQYQYSPGRILSHSMKGIQITYMVRILDLMIQKQNLMRYRVTLAVQKSMAFLHLRERLSKQKQNIRILSLLLVRCMMIHFKE